ncbi:hypothetical protein, partial [Ralstonia edaphi]|uniref:hypothetical protein n=1 Tax=Ralstonia edaphi TaxID=3058599 RepID=UPI0031F2DE38
NIARHASSGAGQNHQLKCEAVSGDTGANPVAVFAFIAQNKCQYLWSLLTPGSFTSAEMESLRAKYRRTHQISLSVAIVLTVIGTVVWGYGDLFFKAAELTLARQSGHTLR